ncbi:hypothetical protein [Sphingomonas colocasiae]|uniref:Flagellar hook-length control protein FliK n=1 Tax=Sphingomonas colocasiae TaxID=1848973 RepID=A0ABS7PSX2_9SPHN|nr:hypothetical protein [Sphingomonas colocasiae]MBY8824441.1 hypothetical protein [Sphingomonas colocasiae]
MPDAAVPALQPIAQFLAIGAPVAADAAVSADFAALLAQQVVDGTAMALPEPGKILPAGRQDLAALQLPVVIVPEDGVAEDGIDMPVADDAEGDDEGSADRAMPEILFPIFAMLSQPVPVRAEPAAGTSDAPVASPSLMQPMAMTAPILPEGAAPVATQSPVTSAMPAAQVAPVAAPAVTAAPGQTMLSSDIVEAVRAAPAAALPTHSVAFVMRADPAATPVTATPFAAAPSVEVALDARPVDGKAEQPVREARPARFVAQPVAEARNAALAIQADPIAEAAPRKSRLPADIAALFDPSPVPGAPTSEFRGVAAASATAAIDALPRDRAVSLVDTIATLRSEARGDTLSLAIQHDDFGRISVRFEQSDDKVVVQFDTQDADLARLIADAAPDLKSAGEPHGMRFERRDATAGNGGAGSNMGGSHDAPRQGRDAATTHGSQRPQSRPTRDRGGIFA